MKKIFSILLAAVTLAACVQEKINHPTEAQVPEASGFEPVITVDQEINQVTFSLDAKAVVPVWVFQDDKEEWSEYHTGSGFKKIFTKMGDYSVRMYVANAAGQSPDYVQKSFHIDNTLANFDRYITFLAGGTSADNTKNWHVDGTVENHLGCGPSGSEGLEWWHAVPGDKEAFGVYGDILTFGGDGAYTYDPGDDGATYVNVDGVTVEPFISQKGDATADYNVTVDKQTATYQFEMHGDDLYLAFPAKTLFPYIDNDAFWDNPEFKVLSVTRETMELVHDNGSIAWHFILTSKAAAVKFNGFNYNADSNIWKPADAAHTYSFYYAPGWSQIADPEVTLEGAEYTLSLPTATSDQWQAQFFIIPDAPVVLSADKEYDFSVIVNSTTTIPNVTFKLTDVGSDNNFLFAERQTINAGEEYIFYRSGLKGIDAPNGVKMVFDFGGNPDGTTVSVARITIKDHAIDDGTVLPSDEPEDPEGPATYTYGPELLDGLYLKETWFSPADWSGGLDPKASFEGGKLTLTVPDGVGGGEWQGQVKLVADIPADPEKQYAFFANVESSNDGVFTVKLADANADSAHAFFYDNAAALTAFEKTAYKNEPVAPDQAYEAVMVIFDFGRLPAGTEITVDGISLKEITGTGGGNGGSLGDNILDGIYLKETWFSPADWSGGLDPKASFEGGKLTLTVPDGVGGGEWQGQVKLVADVPADPEKKYAFFSKIESSTDGVCTVKVADANADSAHQFFYDNAVNLTAFDALSYEKKDIAPDQAYEAVMVIFDFGRLAAGTEITVTDIALREVVGGNGGGEADGYGDNIWTGETLKETWFSPADWSGGLDPKASFEGGKLTLTVPDGIGGGEWQGQVKLVADIAADPAKKYRFTAKIESSTDGVCTVKVADANADSAHQFFYDNAVNLTAYDVLSYVQEGVSPDQAYEAVMVIFDFGRLAAGTEITVTDITLCPEK